MAFKVLHYGVRGFRHGEFATHSTCYFVVPVDRQLVAVVESLAFDIDVPNQLADTILESLLLPPTQCHFRDRNLALRGAICLQDIQLMQMVVGPGYEVAQIHLSVFCFGRHNEALEESVQT